jgi:hypothetical protein
VWTLETIFKTVEEAERYAVGSILSYRIRGANIKQERREEHGQHTYQAIVFIWR